MKGVLGPSVMDVSATMTALDEEERNMLMQERWTEKLVRNILERRHQFGISRVGSVTRLDRIGIPVVQVSRPMALSNAVAQGKGLTLIAAAASALMESIETWAAERLPKERMFTATAKALGTSVTDLYAQSLLSNAPSGWDDTQVQWCQGWDMLSERVLPVPMALVDTVYTVPSPHPTFFPRTTTGLGAGSSMRDAIYHAALESLERVAVAEAGSIPHFFDRYQVDPASVDSPGAAAILRVIHDAGLVAGIWFVPSSHMIPTYWCHVMEMDGTVELAPLPAEGYGCHFDHDRALSKALLEACQSRLAAISGAREDITRVFYPCQHDRSHLAAWRAELSLGRKLAEFSSESSSLAVGRGRLRTLLDSFKRVGAQAVVVVPLFSDAEANIYVVRLIAPANQRI